MVKHRAYSIPDQNPPQNRCHDFAPGLRSVWRQRKAAQVALLLTMVLGAASAQMQTTGTVTLTGSVQAMAGGKHSVLLTWSATAAQNTTFRVYRSTTSGSNYQLVQSLIPCLQYTDLNITNSTTYYYVVTAYNSSTNSESAYSNQVPISIGN